MLRCQAVQSVRRIKMHAIMVVFLNQEGDTPTGTDLHKGT